VKIPPGAPEMLLVGVFSADTLFLERDERRITR
jgi:hypothetical protein